MKPFFKSFVAGLMAAGLFFFFAMMLALPISGLLARTVPARPDVDPSFVLRHVGLPISAVVFLATFVLVFRRGKRRPGSAAAESNLL